jgi:hypothetical protein
MASGHIDVVISTTLRRGASIEARAKYYEHLLGEGFRPNEINVIPEAIFDESARAYEPKRDLTVQLVAKDESAAIVAELLKTTRRLIRERYNGGNGSVMA